MLSGFIVKSERAYRTLCKYTYLGTLLSKIPSVDLYQDHAWIPVRIGTIAIPASPVALALVGPRLGSLTIDQHASSAPSVVVTIGRSINLSPSTRLYVPGCEGEARDVLPGAMAPTPI